MNIDAENVHTDTSSARGATPLLDDDDFVPQTLSPTATWDAAQSSAVIAWWQMTDFLEVAGEDSAQFLDGLTTQALAEQPARTAVQTLFLSNKARIIAAAISYRQADDVFLLELDPDRVDELTAHLARFRLRSKADIRVVERSTVSVVGPDAERCVGVGDTWYDSAAWGSPARTFVGTAAAATGVLARLVGDGVGCADPEALDALRISRGVPSLADMRPGAMPAEVGGMDMAVALDKGCYLGQEPVARLHYRGHANRTLRRVALSDPIPDDVPAPAGGDDPLGLRRPGDERAVGSITTWAALPDGSTMGLAVLRREVDSGEELEVSGTDVRVRAVDSPDDR